MFHDPFGLAAHGSRLGSSIRTSQEGVWITKDSTEYQIPFQVERIGLIEKVVKTIYDNNHFADTVSILMDLARTTVKGRNFFQTLDAVDSRLTNHSRDNFVKISTEILKTHRAPKIHANILSIAETMEYLDKDEPEVEPAAVTVTVEVEPATTAAAEGMAYKRASELVAEFMAFSQDLGTSVEEVKFNHLEVLIKKDAYTAAEGNDQYVPAYYQALYKDCFEAVAKKAGKSLKTDVIEELADWYMAAKFDNLRMLMKVFTVVNSKRSAVVLDFLGLAKEEEHKVNSVADAAKAVASRGGRQLR